MTISDVINMVNMLGWGLRGGHYATGFVRDVPVTHVELKDNKFETRIGAASFDVVIGEKFAARLIADPNPRMITITGTAQVWQKRKQRDGGGMHLVSRELDLFVFVNLAADWAQQRRLEEQRRIDTRNREREDRRRRLEEERRAEERERQARIIELPVGNGESIKCFVLNRDWREEYDTTLLNFALQKVFAGTTPIAVSPEGSTDDTYVLVFASAKITGKQAHDAWWRWVRRDD